MSNDLIGLGLLVEQKQENYSGVGRADKWHNQPGKMEGAERREERSIGTKAIGTKDLREHDIFKERLFFNIFHHLFMFSKTVQLFLQNKDKIVHTRHTYHIFPLMALAYSRPVKRDQKKRKSPNNSIWPHSQKTMPEYIAEQKDVSSVLYPKVSSPFLVLGE